ncbi:hypothetical protein VWO27_09910, partial [Campylobacter coli]|nr:hypothetical protein [Campylobacter coli]
MNTEFQGKTLVISGGTRGIGKAIVYEFAKVGANKVLLFIILSFYTSVAGIFKAKLFPEHVRALGTGLGYAISNAIF